MSQVASSCIWPAESSEPLPTEVAAQRPLSPIVWLLIGYMWLFIHRPFEIWPALAAIRLERVYMLCTLTCWLAAGPQFSARNRLHWRFLAFILVMAASWLLSPYTQAGDVTVENYLKYAVFYVLLITAVREERDLRAILAGYLGVMAVWMLHSLREHYCGNVWLAMDILRMMPVGKTFDPNDFAGLIVSSLPWVWVLWRQWTTGPRRATLLAYLGLAGWCVLLTGSRMGFIGVVLAGLLAIVTSPKRWRLLAACPVVLAAAWTMLPEDRKNRYLSAVDASRGPESAAASAGNLRLWGFEQSLPLFLERPLLGCGPMGFGAAKGTGKMPHNLYGQLLAELGLAGAVAFALILFGVAQNTLEARRIYRNTSAKDDPLPWDTVSAAAAAFVLLVIMSWGFNFLFWHVWLWFGGFQILALHCLRQQAARAQHIDCTEPEW